jgi:hypothetical protein
MQQHQAVRAARSFVPQKPSQIVAGLEHLNLIAAPQHPLTLKRERDINVGCTPAGVAARRRLLIQVRRDCVPG